MRSVMIATPAYDGTVHVRYADALVQTLRACPPDVRIAPVFIPGDALIQRARNEMVQMALGAEGGKGVDDLVFIDADIAWRPADFYRLLSHPVDIVGGCYRRTEDAQTLVFYPRKGAKPDDTGLLPVEGIGCGFLRMTRAALTRLWAKSKPYRNGRVQTRSVFEVTIERGELVSEDVSMCHKWTAMRQVVYADTRIALEHVGEKVYRIEAPKG